MDVPELAYSNQDIIRDSSSDPYCDAVLCCSEWKLRFPLRHENYHFRNYSLYTMLDI